MGVAAFDYSEFSNIENLTLKREYFKYFSGKELMPILSWGVNVKIKINNFQTIIIIIK